MKRALSTAVAVALLLGLGALAVLALPGAQVAGNPAPVVMAAPLAAPEAPNGLGWNAIAMPLDARATLPNAQALAAAIPGAQLVLRWDASIQNFGYYAPGSGAGFGTEVGAPYLVLVDIPSAAVFSMVGDVPPQTGQPNAVKFNLLGGSPCLWNYISLPLDRGSTIVDREGLVSAIGDVQLMLEWDASIQNFSYYVPGSGANNLPVKIGYPYWVCMTAAKDWPQ